MTQNNSKKTVKGRPWKKGQTGNPRGRPKKGASWTELVKELGDLTPAEVKAWVGAIGRKLPDRDDVTLRELAVLAAYVDAVLDPSPRMLQTLMDRAEGRPLQAVEVGGSDTPIHILVEYSEDPFAEAPPDADPGGA